MKAKPLSPELTPEQIQEYTINIEKPATINRLKKTQKAILEILENATEIEPYISNFRERTEIKTIDSILEKINDHRRDDDQSYDLTFCRDLIGTQIICPYPDDVNAVIKWIYDKIGGRKYFNIVTNRRELIRKQKEREARTGYRAYHICLKIKRNIASARSLPPNSENEHFELQIKTALEAGWDFKTHDVSYRAIYSDPDLQQHMKLISNSLSSIDWQTLLLRDRLIEEQLMLQELRLAASFLIFHVTLTDDEKGKLGITNQQIEFWQQSDMEALVNSLEQYLKNHSIDHTYTVGLALIALYCQSRFRQNQTLYCQSRLKQEQALSYASHLVRQAENQNNEPEYISSLRIRALLRWAFHKTQNAVDDMGYLLQITNELRDMNDYLYYFTDLYSPTEEERQLAIKCLKALESSGELKLEHNDTVGAYYIRFGKDRDELKYGLRLVHEAREAARGHRLQPVLDAFCSYHEYIYLRRLSKVS